MTAFVCPMDGTRAEHPGRCPRCGMELMPEAEARREERRYIDDPWAMMGRHPTMYPWCQAAAMILGLWLMTSPFAYGYQSRPMNWNGIASGLAAVFFAAWAALRPSQAWMAYGNGFVGIWVMLAPLAFWAPTAAAYADGTMVGALLITFSVVIPMGMSMPGPDAPPGWSYNPSSWPQRAPIVVLGLIGFFCARYMCAYQLRYIPYPWDPFFGDGTRRVLDSEVSRAWPISDAGLGAVTYMIEILSTFMGDSRRWRTMPWMVALFGFTVVPLGVVSIVLVVLQPVSVGAWCSPCLLAAAAMLVMIPLSLDEVVATAQFLNQSRKLGRPFWRTFWRGGNLPEAKDSKPRSSRLWTAAELGSSLSVSWNLAVSAALGVWLMFSPHVFGSGGAAADSDHLVGALVVTFAVTAMGETGRPARFLNMLLGIWLAAGAWFLGGAPAAARWNSALAGLALLPLSLPLGRIRDRYGSFDPWVSWPRGRR